MKIRYGVALLALAPVLLAAKCTQDGPGKPDWYTPSPKPWNVWVDPSGSPKPLPSGLKTAQQPAGYDPYDEYQKLAPPGAPHLTREEAQARAYLGCGTTWAPGTVDVALRVAYGYLVCQQPAPAAVTR